VAESCSDNTNEDFIGTGILQVYLSDLERKSKIGHKSKIKMNRLQNKFKDLEFLDGNYLDIIERS